MKNKAAYRIILFYRIALAFGIICSSSIEVSAQAETSLALDSIHSDFIREEIHRYLGYEDLFFRYTTLPYDISLNTNESATFLDIGFLYIIFLPLILVLVINKNRWVKIIGSVGLILYLSSCLFFSKIFLSENNQVWSKDQILNNTAVPKGNSFIDNTVLAIYSFVLPVFDSAYSVVKDTLPLDELTYPFIFLVFFSIIYFTLGIKRRIVKNLAIIYLCFSLLFFLLSAGIVWYGFLMIPFSLIILFDIFKKNNSSTITTFLKYSFYGSAFLWILLCFILRISNIQHSNSENDKGTNLFFPNVFSYSVGHKNEGESLDLVYPNLNSVLSEINSNEDLIYRVGTSFILHIDNNHKRVCSDNQLVHFFNLYRRYGNATELFKTFKAYGFRYFIMDLHTATIDKTPDKSLTKKYQLLLETIWNNPDLYLMSTDRKLNVPSGNGTSIVNGIFGDIQYHGNYAIFEII